MVFYKFHPVRDEINIQLELSCNLVLISSRQVLLKWKNFPFADVEVSGKGVEDKGSREGDKATQAERITNVDTSSGIGKAV